MITVARACIPGPRVTPGRDLEPDNSHVDSTKNYTMLASNQQGPLCAGACRNLHRAVREVQIMTSLQFTLHVYYIFRYSLQMELQLFECAWQSDS